MLRLPALKLSVGLNPKYSKLDTQQYLCWRCLPLTMMQKMLFMALMLTPTRTKHEAEI